MPKRLSILLLLQTALQSIAVTNGDSATPVYVGFSQDSVSEADDFPIIVIQPDETTHNKVPHQQQYKTTLSVDVEMLIRCRTWETVEPTERALHDIKRAVLLNAALEKACLAVRLASEKTHDREDGGQFVASSVRFEFDYTESYC